jgi:hypothetical protein
VLVAIVFLCVARAFLLFIKVVLLSWDLTRDCKRAFQHVNNNENKKASVQIHSIQPFGLLFWSVRECFLSWGFTSWDSSKKIFLKTLHELNSHECRTPCCRIPALKPLH